MTVEANIAVVRRYYEAFLSRGELEAVDTIVAADAVFYEPHQVLRGRDGLTARSNAFRAAFPDLVCTMDDVIAQGDKVANRYTLRGTHRGPFVGMPPSGKAITLHGMTIFRLANGQIQEVWGCADLMGFMQQLGALPTAVPAVSEATGQH